MKGTGRTSSELDITSVCYSNISIKYKLTCTCTTVEPYATTNAVSNNTFITVNWRKITKPRISLVRAGYWILSGAWVDNSNSIVDGNVKMSGNVFLGIDCGKSLSRQSLVTYILEFWHRTAWIRNTLSQWRLI